MAEATRNPREFRRDYILDVTVEQKESIMGYHGGKTKPFLRITCALPTMVPMCRGTVQK